MAMFPNYRERRSWQPQRLGDGDVFSLVRLVL